MKCEKIIKNSNYSKKYKVIMFYSECKFCEKKFYSTTKTLVKCEKLLKNRKI